jgi:hypothetical protein
MFGKKNKEETNVGSLAMCDPSSLDLFCLFSLFSVARQE